jgi:hypothetical protein
MLCHFEPSSSWYFQVLKQNKGFSVKTEEENYLFRTSLPTIFKKFTSLWLATLINTIPIIKTTRKNRQGSSLPGQEQKINL